MVTFESLSHKLGWHLQSLFLYYQYFIPFVFVFIKQLRHFYNNKCYNKLYQSRCCTGLTAFLECRWPRGLWTSKVFMMRWKTGLLISWVAGPLPRGKTISPMMPGHTETWRLWPMLRFQVACDLRQLVNHSYYSFIQLSLKNCQLMYFLYRINHPFYMSILIHEQFSQPFTALGIILVSQIYSSI